MNLSLPAYWLLSCYSWQRRSSKNTQIHRFIEILSCTKSNTPLFFGNEEELCSDVLQGCFFNKNLILLQSTVWHTRLRPLRLLHIHVSCDRCKLHIIHFSRTSLEGTEGAQRTAVFEDACVGAQVWDASVQHAPHSVNICIVFWDLKKGNLFQHL